MKKEEKRTDIIITTIKKKRRRNKRKRHCMEITLPQVVVFSQKEKKGTFLSIKISVFFLLFFIRMQLFFNVVVHIDSFTHTSLIASLPPSLKPSRKTDPNEVTCKRTKKKPTTKNKTTKKHKKTKKQTKQKKVQKS